LSAAAGEDDEISFHVGDIITDVQGISEDDNWLYGTAPDGTRGLFPANFVDFSVA